MSTFTVCSVLPTQYFQVSFRILPSSVIFLFHVQQVYVWPVQGSVWMTAGHCSSAACKYQLVRCLQGYEVNKQLCSGMRDFKKKPVELFGCLPSHPTSPHSTVQVTTFILSILFSMKEFHGRKLLCATTWQATFLGIISLNVVISLNPHHISDNVKCHIYWDSYIPEKSVFKSPFLVAWNPWLYLVWE